MTSLPPKHSTVLGDPRIRIIVGDVNQIDIPNGSIDRVIMTCVLHHLPDPYQTLLKIADWMKPGSLFTLFLPSDPGFLVQLNRNLVVIPAARRLGMTDIELTRLWVIEIIIGVLYP